MNRLPLFFLVLLAGCDGETSPASEPGGAAGTSSGTGGSAGTAGTSNGLSRQEAETLVRTHYCQPQAKQLCRRLDQCGCGQILPGGSLDVQACETRQVAACMTVMEQAILAMVSGQRRFDPTAAEACVQAFQKSDPCALDTADELLWWCRPPFLTHVAELGAPCNVGPCADGQGWCSQQRCEALPTVGQPCLEGVCAPGLVCDRSDDACRVPLEAGADCSEAGLQCTPPLACLQGKCQARGQLGEACADTTACRTGLECRDRQCQRPQAPCETDGCGFQSSCISAATCQMPGAEGAPCASDIGCQTGLFCSDEGRCLAAAPLDEPCSNGVYCSSGLACRFEDFTCQPIPEQGQPCALDVMGPFLCSDGMGCVEGVCQPLPGLNQRCALPDRCSLEDQDGDGHPDLGCDFTPLGSLCVRRQAAGQTCSNDGMCQAGLFCELSTNRCQPWLGEDAPCTDGNECGPERTCTRSETGVYVCRTRPVLGEACQFECAGDLVCQSGERPAVCVAPICQAL